MDNIGKILHYLAKTGDMFTLHELSKLTGIPYATFYRTVKKMGKLVNIISKGQSKLITLNWNELTRAHLVLASGEQEREALKKNPLLKQLDEKAKGIVLIFGSYANNTQTNKSDVDVMVINENGKKTIKFRDLELLYDKEINPIFFSKEEFVAMLQDKEENVAKQALKNHILLSGFENFWKLVENGTRSIQTKI